MVIEPASQMALMRLPFVLVAGRYLVRMACMAGFLVVDGTIIAELGRLSRALEAI